MNIAIKQNNQYYFDQIQGNIQLYPNESLGLVQIQDDRSISRRIKDTALASFNSLQAIGTKVYRVLSANKSDFPAAVLNEQNIFEYPKEVLPWNDATESEGVYFFIHGLWGFPTDWNAYVKERKQNDPDAHIFVPWIPKLGNCSLETVGKPVLDALVDYMTKFPNKPVRLIGTSNGGRMVAKYLEANLDPKILGNASLSIVSIAGVHYGTKVIDFLEKIKFLRCMDKELKEEFYYGSQAAQNLLKGWQEKQTVWKEGNHQVRHYFGATTEDEKVREIACSLPYHEDAVSTYKVISGHSHTSIVDEMRKDVLNWLDLKIG